MQPRHAARRVIAFVVTAMLTALVVGTQPAIAHDPEEFHDHPGPGSTGPDQHSRNMKLLGNVPRAAGTTVQSDLAFFGKYAVAGNYQGFRVIDVSDPENPQTVTDFRCNGAQSDVSIYGGLLFQSVDSPQSHGGCNSTSVGITASTPGMFEGVRIFDISNPLAPAHVRSVDTDCGSHTHTLVPGSGRVYVYVSSYPLGFAAQGPNCSRAEDGTGHGIVSIIEVPLSDPSAATVSKYHLDEGTEQATYPLQGTTFSFKACHDISVFVEIQKAAAACLSESQLWDISDPAHPELEWRFDDPVVNPSNIDLWHSATFSWDGKMVAFGDESGGGTSARCSDPDDQQGRIWFLNTATGKKLANYKVPRSIATLCTMHNFNFIPLGGGRDVLVSSAYTAGTTVIDVDKLVAGATPAQSEIGFYQASGGNTWSSYWYNGFIYGNDINRGVDIMMLSHPVRAGAKKLPMLNPQTQERLIP